MAIDQEIINQRFHAGGVGVSGNGQGAFQPGGIIAASKAMREILEVVRRSAPTDAPLLIYGEPATGKKRIACEVHRQSRRAAGPFVHVACGAVRESELAETLFGRGQDGTERNSPATAPPVEKARGGTLFLEDVAQLPLWSQVRLLDVLQQPSPARGGRPAGLGIDVRVIASSTIDLPVAVGQRTFLSSLYYYLKVVEIHVPPLRRRGQDIAPLAENYLAMANAWRAGQGGKPPCRFAPGAMQCLVDYDWPGNTLQLASIVAHAALLTDGDEIAAQQIVELLGAAAPSDDAETISVPLTGGLKDIERAVVAAVIERCRGNKAEAARVLGLHRREVYRILQRKLAAKEEALPLPLVLGAAAGDCAANAYS